MKLASYATENQFSILAKPRRKTVFLYRFVYRFFLKPILISIVATQEYSKLFENYRQHFFWLGRYKCMVYLIEDCLECQTTKMKRHDLHEAPLEQWGELETTPFKTIHFDHKGPLRPASKSNTHCLVVIDAFFDFLELIHLEVLDLRPLSMH